MQLIKLARDSGGRSTLRPDTHVIVSIQMKQHRRRCGCCFAEGTFASDGCSHYGIIFFDAVPQGSPWGTGVFLRFCFLIGIPQVASYRLVP